MGWASSPSGTSPPGVNTSPICFSSNHPTQNTPLAARGLHEHKEVKNQPTQLRRLEILHTRAKKVILFSLPTCQPRAASLRDVTGFRSQGSALVDPVTRPKTYCSQTTQTDRSVCTEYHTHTKSDKKKIPKNDRQGPKLDTPNPQFSFPSAPTLKPQKKAEH